MENRSEPRENECLVVYINGRDKSGHAFTQEAVASSLSGNGALLSGITTQCDRVTCFGLNMGAEGRASKYRNNLSKLLSTG
jgi:hypothetical protein